MIGWVVAAILLVLLVATLVAAYHQIDVLRSSVDNEQSSHYACHEATENLLRLASIRTDATALMAAADAWDSFEEKGTIARLARIHVEDGPSVPALWLRDRANQMFADSDA